MHFDWQNAIALLMVAVAICFLARRSWLTMRRRSKKGCGGCGSCSANKTSPDGKPIVSLENLLKPTRSN